ncbi:MAG: hypothetical protein EPN72_12285 [Nevskiaceae bacterium]|nr:MAG: hypothetical protein EPN63_00690 [Nevskiaceae bacterium]TBR71954.1 MAG: hypothetical protein EPN72_12285 [Nevskiaceae bacterium]
MCQDSSGNSSNWHGASVMKPSTSALGLYLLLSTALCLVGPKPAWAGGGYFILGYGPYAEQMAGTSTAVGADGSAGASNPGKLFDAGNRLDLGVLTFLVYRRIERSGATDGFNNFSITSKNGSFYMPDFGFAHRISNRFSLGLTVYANGGLNTSYDRSTGVPDTNANPGLCGHKPGNFIFGCDKFGLDLNQVIFAPALSWKFAPGQSIGIAPLLAYQRIRIYGFQAFVPYSERPDDVTNRGYDQAFGGGVRIGWYAHVTPWLDLGAAYASQIYMQKFDRYQGLLANHGRFNVPENYSIGAAVKPWDGWVVAIDIQRIDYHEVPALGNGVLNSLKDPEVNPLGSKNGSGLNWRNQTNYRLGVEYMVSPRFTLRAGYAYGRRPDDESSNSTTLNMMTPNPIVNVTLGFSWSMNDKNDLNFAYGRYLAATYKGPSSLATLPGIGPAAMESMRAFVDTIYLGWSWHM